MPMRAAVLIAGCLTTGCYSYQPLTAPAPEPGTSVAVTLTDAGTLALGRYLGPDAFIVRGRYLSASDQGVVLSVASVETKGGDWASWSGESVSIPTADVASVEVRRFANGKSALLASAGVAGLVATMTVFDLFGFGTPSGSGAGGGKR